MTSSKPKLQMPISLTLLSLLTATSLWSQVLYQGPEAGSIPGGAAINTGGFAFATETLDRQWLPPATLPVRLLPDELNRVAPSAPLRANEFYDASIGASEVESPRQLSGFPGIPDLGASIPPDPHMAAGPNHLMAVVNSRFGIFDKAGNVLKLINADAWFANVLPNADPFDPQVVYDHHAERWIMVWIHLTESPANAKLLLSISDDSDPLGTWCNWSLPDNSFGPNTVNFFGDFPKLGIDQNAVYVTSNMFNIPAAGRSFQGTRVRVIPKAQLLDNACGPVTWNDLWDLRDPNNLSARVFTVTPAIVYGTPDQQFLFSDAPYATGTFVTLWELFDPIGTPFLAGTNIPVTASRSPTNADQLGGSTTLIDGGLNRIFRHAPVYRDGHMWGVQGVAGGTNNAFAFVRYLRINVSTYRAVDDAAFGADNFWYIYPVAMPDANGNLFINFTRTGHTEYASARFTGRLAADPPGLQASTLLKAGEANYVKTFGGTRNRWGDYLGIALDPVDSSKVWMLGQYAASEVGTGANADRWGTWVGATTFTPLPGRHVRFEPDSIHYATLELGQKSLPFPAVLSNIGTDNVTVASVRVGTPSFVLSGVPALPKTLASFNDLAFSVAFDPKQAGALRDTIKIRASGNQTVAAVPLSGRALGTATLQGVVRDSSTNAPIKARLQFFRGNETTPRATATTAANGSYSVLVLEGDYAVDVLPEIPHAPERRTLAHTFNGTTLNFALTPASVVLVNDDSVATSLEVYKTQLGQLGYKYALWNLRDEGTTVPANRLPLLAEPRLMVWFTGETKAEVLTPEDRNVIIGHLAQGHPVLLSGDNIAETSAPNDSLLAQYFGVEFNGNFASAIIRGFTGDPIGNGLLTGAQGASKDLLQLTASANSLRNRVFRYVTSTADTVTSRVAAVRAENAAQGWRAVFYGYRLESTATSTRRTIFERTLNWLKEPGTVAVEERATSNPPENFYLSQNHPNPFNPSTTITFQLPHAAFATLRVYDLSGRVIATLANERRTAGAHRVKFEAHGLTAGVYFYRLQAGENVATRKLVLLR